jgi:hypothetical protein
MKKLVGIFALVSVITVIVYVTAVQAEFKGSPHSPHSDARFDELERDGEGNRVASKVTVCKYDFADDAGAIGSIDLGCDLPDNAIVTNVWGDILTAFVTSGNNGTIALTGNAAADLLAAVDADTLSNQFGGAVQWATESGYVKTTAKRDVTLVIASEAVTAGKAIFYINYMVSE